MLRSHWLEFGPALVLLGALALTLALYGLAVAGHFPRENRGDALRKGLGPALLWSTALAAVLSAMAGAHVAANLLPLPHAVITAGSALLAAPLLLKLLPEGFVDGRGALLVFSGLAAALAVAFARLAG